MAYQPVEAVEVRIWEHRVGAVALDPRLGFYAFEYEPRFRATRLELAPLQLPLRTAVPTAFPSLAPGTWFRLPAFLADALPDDFGNALIDAWMARNGVSKPDITPLDRLAYMSTRGFGALEFKPARGPARRAATALDLKDLVETARRAVGGNLGEAAETTQALAQLFQVGTSAGGARAKAAVAWNPATDELRSGQFDAPPGFEHWLLKFDGVSGVGEIGAGASYGRVEYAYHLMTRAAGITMSDCRLLEEGGRAHFMTRRFDRVPNRKAHLQSLCAMAHLDFRLRATHGYEQFFDTMVRLGLPEEDLVEGFRRMVFNAACANCDDHTKNHAFILRPNEPWRLAPAFDVTHSYSPSSTWVSQHLMSVNGRFLGITTRDCIAVAERFGIGGVRQVIAEVVAAAARWPEFAKKAGVPADRAKAIQTDFPLAELGG